MTPLSELPHVRMEQGLLLCPGCGSGDLMPDAPPGALTCEDCGERCARHADQCQRCGARGITSSEQVAFPAPGQSPKEVQSKVIRSCPNCGYASR